MPKASIILHREMVLKDKKRMDKIKHFCERNPVELEAVLYKIYLQITRRTKSGLDGRTLDRIIDQSINDVLIDILQGSDPVGDFKRSITLKDIRDFLLLGFGIIVLIIIIGAVL